MARRDRSPLRRRAPARRWIRARVRTPGALVAGATGRFEIELSIVETLPAGASIRLAWPLGWTPPTSDKGPGQVAWRVSGRALILGEIVRRRHLRLNLTGGALGPGDSIVVTCGGEPDGATVQPWLTDRPPRFEIKVDREATGRFSLDEWATVELAPGPPAYLHVVGPSTLACGKTGTLRLAVLDRFGNLCPAATGEALIRAADPEDAPENRMRVVDGRAEMPIAFDRPGIRRVVVVLPDLGLSGRSNPCRVGDPAGGPYWGDPHVHTRISDGAGSPQFALRYARETALLDFTAITDHDIEYHHAWFARPSQRTSDAEWAYLGDLIRHHREPGRFAVLRGYEWTGRPWGDKCVYLRSDAARIRRYEAGEAATPAALWRSLREEGVGRVLTVPHTPASNFMGTEWAEHDAEIERLAEVYSMHGASEYKGCPKEMINTVAGRHVRDALARGYRLGLIAAGDTHSSQPGNPLLRLGPYRTLRHKAGLTAVYSSAPTEDAIFDALLDRRVYATTGARILLWFAVNDTPLGGELALTPGGRAVIHGHVSGTAPLAEVAVVRDGRTVFAARPGAEDFELAWEDPTPPLPGGSRYYYLRAEQVDEETAWSSPVWVTTGPAI